jgi:hypothetical protein
MRYAMAYFRDERDREIARFELPQRQREVQKIREAEAEKRSAHDAPHAQEVSR